MTDVPGSPEWERRPGVGGKKIRIPNDYVRMNLDEVAVTETRMFQRLNNMKQLGLAYMVYPGATHTRGAHSIQCLHEADKILRAIDVDGNEARIIRMAALLHDIGHLPFSHTLEDEHIVLEKHDHPNRLIMALESVKKGLPSNSAELVDAAKPVLLAISKADGYPQDWRSDVIGNTICADLLAYITPDATWTGIEKRPGYYPLYDYFERQNNRLCIRLTKGGLRTDIVSAIVDILDMRYALTERVLFHHAKCAASAMLARAARLLQLSDGSNVIERMMGDESFLDHLEGLATQADNAGAQRLLSDLRSRQLHKRIFKVEAAGRDAWDKGRSPKAFCRKWRDAQEVEQLLCDVEGAHRLPRGALVLWCPTQEAAMKLARVQVVWNSADRLQGPEELRSPAVANWFPGVHNRVDTLEKQYLDLWTFWILLDRRCLDHAAGVVRSIEERIGVECDRAFVETYLHSHLSNYKQSAAGAKTVTELLQKLRPEIEEMVAERVAQGDADLNEGGILEVTKQLVEEKIRLSTETPTPKVPAGANAGMISLPAPDHAAGGESNSRTGDLLGHLDEFATEKRVTQEELEQLKMYVLGKYGTDTSWNRSPRARKLGNPNWLHGFRSDIEGELARIRTSGPRLALG